MFAQFSVVNENLFQKVLLGKNKVEKEREEMPHARHG
jgi:hypothetical protein